MTELKLSSIKKILICPDSFKGSLNNMEICHIIESQLQKKLPGIKIKSLPLADGGEGTGVVFKDWFPIKISTTALNAGGKPISTHFHVNKELKAAFIESAEIIGLPLIPKDQRNPMHATSYGLGELIKKGISLGCEDIYISLGGSGTNDGGMGMARALGYKFYDKSNKELPGYGKDLINITKIEYLDKEIQEIKKIKFHILTDVDNPLTGKDGATAVFALQKGARKEDIPVLEEGLCNLDKVCRLMNLKKDINKNTAGAGAAGGLGYGCKVFLDGEIIKGIDFIMEKVEFNKELPDTDLIITGEGKLDIQSLNGKVISGILKRASLLKIPVIVFTGYAENKILLQKAGITKIYEIAESGLSLEQNMQKNRAKKNLTRGVDLMIQQLKEFPS